MAKQLGRAVPRISGDEPAEQELEFADHFCSPH